MLKQAAVPHAASCAATDVQVVTSRLCCTLRQGQELYQLARYKRSNLLWARLGVLLPVQVPGATPAVAAGRNGCQHTLQYLSHLVVASVLKLPAS
jgi:hypothetical protein